MKLIEEADRYVSGRDLAPTTALRLAARLEKAIETASRAEAGLVEAARERVLGHLLATAGDGVRVARAREAGHEIVIRSPRGKRAPAALLGLDRLPPTVRERLEGELNLTDEEDEESVPGLDVRPVETALRAVFADMDSSACLLGAGAAEEAYEYDRALAGYRLAVLRSGGALEPVRALVRFLGEIYADSGEIAELLASARIDTESHRDLHLQLAHAHVALGDAEEARAHYERLLRDGPDRTALLNLTRLLLQVDEVQAAERWLRQALELDPSDPEGRALMDECAQARGSQADHLIESAEAAFARGALPEAREVLERLGVLGLSHPRAGQLEQRIAAAEAAAQSAELVARAREQAAAGDWRSAAVSLREATRADPGIGPEIAALAQEVEAALAAEDCASHLKTGGEREDAGDTVGALHAYYRAIQTGVATPDDAMSPLHDRLRAHLAREGAPKKQKALERTLDGLAALHEADGHARSGRAREAEAGLREARRHLRNHPDIAAVERLLREHRTSSSLDQATAQLAEATAREAAGDLAGALRSLDRVVSLAGERWESAGERRRALRERVAAEETRRSLLARLQRMADGEEWFRLRREAADFSEEPDVAALAQRADTTLATAFGTTALACPDTRGALLTAALGIAAEPARDTSIVTFGQDEVLLAAGDRLVVAGLPDLDVRWNVQLPATVRPEREGWRIFACGSEVLLLDATTRRLTRVTEGRISDQVELDRNLPVFDEPSALARESAFDAASGRLLVLATGSGRTPSRLLSIDATDGQVRNSESFSFTAFNLRPIDGTDRFAVQRRLDFRVPFHRQFNFAVVDARAKVERRVFYPDLEEPMHAVRRLIRLPDGYACHYWFLAPYSGQVVQESHGLAILKDDWTIRYNNSHPEVWLGPERGLAGALCVHPASETLFLPWRTFGMQRTDGFSSFSLTRFEPRWDAALPEGHELLHLAEHRSRARCYAVVRELDGIAVREVDISGHGLR